MATSQSSISTTGAPGDFPSFKRLPLELRDEIWSYYLPGPRIVEIVERNLPTGAGQPAANHIALLQSSIGAFNAPMMLLSVTPESRALVKRKYGLVFEDVLVHPVYINFNIDVLAIFTTPVWTTFLFVAQTTGDDQIEFDPVKSLALPAPTPTYDPRALLNTAIEANKYFPSLKLLFVAQPPMYWAVVNSTSPVVLGEAEIKDLVTLHRQMVFRGVDRGERWEASDVEIVTEGVLRLRYPDT